MADPKTILVVENDLMSRELCRRVLTAGGYVVALADNAEEALRVAPALRPSLVLMDLRLPGMDGIEATRRLRARAATRSIPIAVLSAQAFGEDVARARSAGCSEYLTKPIGARELLDRVHELVGEHAAPPKRAPRPPAQRPRRRRG